MEAILIETLKVGTVLFMASVLLHYTAYKKGIYRGKEGNDDILDELDDDLADKNSTPITKKWLEFGGGYYGCVAFTQLIFIEFKQVREFVADWQGWDNLVQGSGLNAIIRLLVNAFVEQFHNFAAAISWPAHYVSNYPIAQCFVFVVVTYVLFYWGQSLAWRRFNNH
ncbi:hypothetical protein [Alteromonas flava]|uniref:hypothetical protein n=1 Tax=Alteromonas flava TaxID=2048003 RepID=UPI000C28174D|nr:hypothetical protein [Alteromonas flava]